MAINLDYKIFIVNLVYRFLNTLYTF